MKLNENKFKRLFFFVAREGYNGNEMLQIPHKSFKGEKRKIA